MSDHWAIALVGFGIGLLQALILFVLASIKSDIKDIWARMYDHYHEVQCENKECGLRTGNVVVPGPTH